MESNDQAGLELASLQRQTAELGHGHMHAGVNDDETFDQYVAIHRARRSPVMNDHVGLTLGSENRSEVWLVGPLENGKVGDYQLKCMEESEDMLCYVSPA